MPRDPLILSRIPQALEERVLAECERTGSSKSELLRAALTAFLDQAGASPARGPRVAPAARKRSGACEHRVRPGAWCNRCGALVL